MKKVLLVLLLLFIGTNYGFSDFYGVDEWLNDKRVQWNRNDYESFKSMVYLEEALNNRVDMNTYVKEETVNIIDPANKKKYTTITRNEYEKKTNKLITYNLMNSHNNGLLQISSSSYKLKNGFHVFKKYWSVSLNRGYADVTKYKIIENGKFLERWEWNPDRGYYTEKKKMTVRYLTDDDYSNSDILIYHIRPLIKELRKMLNSRIDPLWVKIFSAEFSNHNKDLRYVGPWLDLPIMKFDDFNPENHITAEYRFGVQVTMFNHINYSFVEFKIPKYNQEKFYKIIEDQLKEINPLNVNFYVERHRHFIGEHAAQENEHFKNDVWTDEVVRIKLETWRIDK